MNPQQPQARLLGAVLLLAATHPAYTQITTYTDLHPEDLRSSNIIGMAGGHQVGFGLNWSRRFHALLWKGTAESMIDLTPPIWPNAWATDTDGPQQVGYVFAVGMAGQNLPSQRHAALWEESA
jgi:hypothetical protein